MAEVGAEQPERMTLIVFSGELDRAIAAFILATTAAAMGIQVTMFFTFWGLNIIKRNEGAVRSQGLMRRMLNWMNRGGSSRLPLSRFHMFGMGTSMMKRLMRESRMPSVDEFIKMAHQAGVKMVACSTSMGVMGIDESAFRPEVQTVCGAAAYLGDALNAKINLFI
ncbi:MAG: DsrE/DsrF/DrsH-like family protein [Chloroflexi bacterium]|nr:DsrE/DsrF/DrsH-like family protein [Chloroflexota bacterium]